MERKMSLFNFDSIVYFINQFNKVLTSSKS
jgi:hypothetical protein